MVGVVSALIFFLNLYFFLCFFFSSSFFLILGTWYTTLGVIFLFGRPWALRSRGAQGAGQHFSFLIEDMLNKYFYVMCLSVYIYLYFDSRTRMAQTVIYIFSKMEQDIKCRMAEWGTDTKTDIVNYRLDWQRNYKKCSSC